jgi:CTP:molybdopterin cytidylyltransferase MocA
VKSTPAATRPAIPAIVLAAGGSTRMGRSKARLPIQPDGTFLGRILRTLAEAGLDPLIVVTRERLDIPSLWRDARSARVIEVINPEPARGQLSSLLCGLDAIAQPPQAVLMTLVDVPLPAVATVGALVASWHRTRVPLVRPLHAGRHGHPVIFGDALLKALRDANPADGAKPIVRTFASRGIDVAVDDPGVLRDVDTPEDYRQILDARSR